MALPTQPIIIGNWKMNLTIAESENLARKMVTGIRSITKQAEVIICPSFPALGKIKKIIAKSTIHLGAQNMFWYEQGSYTGEVSVKMLKELGCEYVIIGHSERRIYIKETFEEINQKVKLAIAYGLIPIICVGEKFEERQAGQTDVVIMNDVASALKGIVDFEQIIIAYEPVWVIGRGEAINPEEAQTTATLIEYTLRDIYSQNVVDEKIKILYGGSVDDQNVNAFVSGGIQGVLVGGSSLKPKIFLGIINNLIAHVN